MLSRGLRIDWYVVVPHRLGLTGLEYNSVSAGTIPVKRAPQILVGGSLLLVDVAEDVDVAAKRDQCRLEKATAMLRQRWCKLCEDVTESEFWFV